MFGRKCKELGRKIIGLPTVLCFTGLIGTLINQKTQNHKKITLGRLCKIIFPRVSRKIRLKDIYSLLRLINTHKLLSLINLFFLLAITITTLVWCRPNKI